MFGWKAATFQVSDLPDLSGKVFLITGGTAGLGLSSAVSLASKNATVIISARNDEKGQKAVEEIKKQVNNPDALVSYGVMEQSDLKSVKHFADWFLTQNIPLHVLLLNAGVAMVAPKLIDGIESHFLINHVSHFYLCQLLLDKIKASAPSRVVFVASDAHKAVKSIPDWKMIAANNYKDSLGASFVQYGHSKLANIYTAIELSRQLEGENVFVNSIHPGAVASEIGKKVPFANTFIGKGVLTLVNSILSTPQRGCLTQVYVAAHPDIEVKQYRGQYFVPTAHKEELNEIATNEESQKDLWKFTQDLIHSLQ